MISESIPYFSRGAVALNRDTDIFSFSDKSCLRNRSVLSLNSSGVQKLSEAVFCNAAVSGVQKLSEAVFCDSDVSGVQKLSEAVFCNSDVSGVQKLSEAVFCNADGLILNALSIIFFIFSGSPQVTMTRV